MTMRQTALTLFLCLLSLTAGAAVAPDWKPEKAIEIIVGVTPGGPNDTSARLLQKVMQDKRLVTVPVSVSNRAGANNALASVLFCTSTTCGWREWAVVDACPDVQRLAKQGCKPAEIAARLGLSERTVFRRLAERVQ